jgi:Flp pilus assembly protein TadG
MKFRHRGRSFSVHDDSGFVAGSEGLLFGVVVYVVGGLLMANVWSVVDAKSAVAAAAREATRSYVESPDQSSAEQAAQIAARNAIHGQGWNPKGFSLTMATGADHTFARCVRVRAVATQELHLVRIPLVGAFGSRVEVSAQYSELIDPYRAGVGGEAVCD